ncbi:hypothetical protein JCM3766R1_003965 [Sporobolomyces carnicolor]
MEALVAVAYHDGQNRNDADVDYELPTYRPTTWVGEEYSLEGQENRPSGSRNSGLGSGGTTSGFEGVSSAATAMHHHAPSNGTFNVDGYAALHGQSRHDREARRRRIEEESRPQSWGQIRERRQRDFNAWLESAKQYYRGQGRTETYVEQFERNQREGWPDEQSQAYRLFLNGASPETLQFRRG